jgi:hypothetical protein
VPTALRLLLHAPVAAMGVVAGGLGSFVHPLRLAGLPLGLACALALSAAAFVTGGMAVGRRSGAAAAAVGWLVPVLVLSAPRPEGDLVVTGSALGYTWMVGGMLAAGLAIAWPYGPGPPGAPSSAPSPVGR